MNQHTFALFDHYFLFDTPTNSLFSIDKPAYMFLKERSSAGLTRAEEATLAEISPLALREVEKELAFFEDKGVLSKEDPFLMDPVTPLPLGLKALCLHLAHDCQLKCAYCFAGGGAFGGDRSLMSHEVGIKAIDFLLERSEEKDYLEIDFFGGEPLLNQGLLFELVGYGKKQAALIGKALNFTLTTNTLGLNREVLEFLREERMGLVLSIDGRPAVNDRMRGKGTYDLIMPRIMEVVEDFPEINYYVRGTFTRYNLDFTEDLRHLYALGIRSLSLEPVVCDPKLPYAIREEDLPRIFEEYERLAAYWWERYQAGDPFRFFHFVVDLEKAPCLPKRLLGCGAGVDYLAVTPQGELYPCHQFVGEERFRLGTVFTGIDCSEIKQTFTEARFFKKEGCADCWARYYCSGGCHANAYYESGSILRPSLMACRLQKKRLECALGLKALQMEEEG